MSSPSMEFDELPEVQRLTNGTPIPRPADSRGNQLHSAKGGFSYTTADGRRLDADTGMAE